MSEELLKIEAVVKFNDDQAYVFNRKPVFEYERVGNLLIAQDGPFFNSFRYKRDQFAKAFAGRKFKLKLKNGAYEECDGQWWDANIKHDDFNVIPVTYGTKKELIDCYVFSGLQMIKDELEKLLLEYVGCVYPYWEYETIICAKSKLEKRFKSEEKLRKQISKLRRDKEHLIKSVKAMSLNLRSKPIHENHR